MAMLETGLKQRMVGALVLVALAVIFLPMLLNRSDELRHVSVEAPSIPAEPAVPTIELSPVDVPEPEAAPAAEPEQPVVVEAPSEPASASEPPPITALPLPETPAVNEPAAPAAEPAPAVTESQPGEQHLDAASLPVSWSVQLAALSNRANAEALQQTLRSQGYNAYIRSAGNINRVFVGPLVERAEANRLRDQLQRQHKLDGLVVRFEPERG